MKKFLVTTPIYYPNGYPHIGHAYSSFIADFYARYKRLLGYAVKFSTWNDENSQNVLKKAAEESKEIMPYLDAMAQKWKEVRDHLQISYTDFIRTTQNNHKKLVQEMLQKSFDKWDIYQWTYEGHYCVGCEAFKTEKDLIEKDGQMVCPDHLTKPDLIMEKNRFFKLSGYETSLKELYARNPDFVVPEHRFNEVKSFVNGSLIDFSVSRETNKFGIPLPFDPSQVTYVWYDALFNYVTISRNEGFWNNETEIVHVLGKDISRFHAIFRPAMLMSADEKCPDREYITGYFTVDGHKMSKSLGNVVDPVQMVNDYDRDAVIFNLLYDVPIWADGDFSVERLANLYDSMLIWGRGNLVNRVTSLCEKYKINDGVFILKKREMFKWEDLDPEVSRAGDSRASENGLFKLFEEDFNADYIEEKYLNKAHIRDYLEDRYKLVQKANEFITKAEPRKKYKRDATKAWAISDLQFLLYIVKNLALISAPFLVNGFKKIQNIFGNEELSFVDSSVSSADNDNFKKAFDMREFKVELKPIIIYQKKEENDKNPDQSGW